MEFKKTNIQGVYIIEPRVFNDARGYFFEAWKREEFKANVGDVEFIQDNESFSSRGVVRGLHWQAAPHTQAKLVRVVRGAVWDVAVDIRKGSPTFGRHVAVTLSAENRRQLYIPRGFAHGFIVLEDETLFSYKCDCKEADRGLLFSDPALGIEWPDLGIEIKLSEKDIRNPLLRDIEPWEEK